LIVFSGLVHLRVALSAGILGRRGRVDDGGIDNGAGCNANALIGKVAIDLIQHPSAEFVLFK
jgi:hypothetical protein